MKSDFLEFIQILMDANPEIVKEKMTDEIREYLEILKELVDKAESKGFRDVRDGHKRCSLFGRQCRRNSV